MTSFAGWLLDHVRGWSPSAQFLILVTILYVIINIAVQSWLVVGITTPFYLVGFLYALYLQDMEFQNWRNQKPNQTLPTTDG